MRLGPLPDEHWDERSRSALAGFLPAKRRHQQGAGNALSTLVRHPDLAEAFLVFNSYLMMESTVPARLRELAILRVARRRHCAYEEFHHIRIGAKAGLTPAEIEAAGRGEALDPLEIAVLRAVDELDDDSIVSEQTWTTLSEHLSDHQRMDLIFTIGAYCLMAMAFNTFGVEPETER
jgi:alkylhydroperoxidase family enzyme